MRRFSVRRILKAVAGVPAVVVRWFQWHIVSVVRTAAFALLFGIIFLAVGLYKGSNGDDEAAFAWLLASGLTLAVFFSLTIGIGRVLIAGGITLAQILPFPDGWFHNPTKPEERQSVVWQICLTAAGIVAIPVLALVLKAYHEAGLFLVVVICLLALGLVNKDLERTRVVLGFLFTGVVAAIVCLLAWRAFAPKSIRTAKNVIEGRAEANVNAYSDKTKRIGVEEDRLAKLRADAEVKAKQVEADLERSAQQFCNLPSMAGSSRTKCLEETRLEIIRQREIARRAAAGEAVPEFDPAPPTTSSAAPSPPGPTGPVRPSGSSAADEATIKRLMDDRAND